MLRTEFDIYKLKYQRAELSLELALYMCNVHSNFRELSLGLALYNVHVYVKYITWDLSPSLRSPSNAKGEIFGASKEKNIKYKLYIFANL